MFVNTFSMYLLFVHKRIPVWTVNTSTHNAGCRCTRCPSYLYYCACLITSGQACSKGESAVHTIKRRAKMKYKKKNWKSSLSTLTDLTQVYIWNEMIRECLLALAVVFGRPICWIWTASHLSILCECIHKHKLHEKSVHGVIIQMCSLNDIIHSTPLHLEYSTASQTRTTHNKISEWMNYRVHYVYSKVRLKHIWIA